MIKSFVILAFVILVFLYIRYIEHKSIFIPFREITDTPKRINLGYADIFFKTSDGKELNGWFVPFSDSSYTLLFFHGNGGNISHRLEKISIFYQLGLNIFIIDYRGYGRSNGYPNEKGLYQDSQAAYNYLISEKRIPSGKIIVYGESLGGACAVDVAYKNSVAALILDSTFTNAVEMANIIYPYIPNLLFASRFDSMDKIKQIIAPKLIIHSVNDEIVPFKLGEKLFQNAKEPKHFLSINGSHNTNFIDSREKYISGIKEFISIIR